MDDRAQRREERESAPHAGQAKPAKNASPVEDGHEICPQCGRALQAIRCKLVCPCGYFMSCSEF